MHTNKCYQLGADVKVEVVRANLEKKQIDFRLIEEGMENKPAGTFSPKVVREQPTKQRGKGNRRGR
jgi:hypothetical protein